MRLWHQQLIPILPRYQLLGQHRECCALRGKGWGKKHSVINYVFQYNPTLLEFYHFLVMEEMIKRGYKPNKKWFISRSNLYKIVHKEQFNSKNIYPEHNYNYLVECCENLKVKLQDHKKYTEEEINKFNKFYKEGIEYE